MIKNILLGVEFIIILVLSILLIYSYEKNDKEVLFEEGYYINSTGATITELDYDILSLSTRKEDINNLSKDDIDSIVNQYYIELEAYGMYGYIGNFKDTDMKTNFEEDIKVLKLVSKHMPFVKNTNSVEGEYYCNLGMTKAGNFIISKYDKDTKECILDEKVCAYIKDTNIKSYISKEKYCNE